MKLQTNKKCYALAIIMASTVATSAYAAESAELKVTGKIVPTSCEIDLSGSGTVDYGDISARELTGAAPIQLTISCDSKSQVAYKISDNRANTVVPNLIIPLDGSEGISSSYSFGLGKVGEKNLGAWNAVQSDLKVDGFAAVSMLNIGGDNFTQGSDLNHMPLVNGNEYSWYRPDLGGSSPSTGKVFSSSIQIAAALDKAISLNQANEVKLDGSATLSVRYL
ncbi:P pilus assembly protein, pilin FimA [Serratia quinivorans]|uniref:DUF1120 domain-containing protein n=1 Tax=Serratia quinivorans TaxID=137545 RepID=UPI002178F672|nr:DUF1120 domain-containing protein [Serratia quinivorans]CAI1874702.1 P pilus assembly protein, pilin FimA [Serratia quinivorans]CAI1899718.1 P pilus assembly protein, pilin FimA [Serratia quinivorans]